MNWTEEFILLAVCSPFLAIFGYFCLCLVLDVLRESGFTFKIVRKRLYGPF